MHVSPPPVQVLSPVISKKRFKELLHEAKDRRAWGRGLCLICILLIFKAPAPKVAQTSVTPPHQATQLFRSGKFSSCPPELICQFHFG
jgi:hypothetical protein